MGRQAERDVMSQILVEIQTLEERLIRIEQQREEPGFGDALRAGYVEPKPPDRAWRTRRHKPKLQQLPPEYHDRFVPQIYTFPGGIYPEDYLEWERDIDDWFSYHGVPRGQGSPVLSIN